jgi:hypothetical protein
MSRIFNPGSILVIVGIIEFGVGRGPHLLVRLRKIVARRREKRRKIAAFCRLVQSLPISHGIIFF